MSAEADAYVRLIREAIRFSYWAAGQGLCPVEGEDAGSPEDFFYDFGQAVGDEEWDTLAERISNALAQAPAMDAVVLLSKHKGKSDE